MVKADPVDDVCRLQWVNIIDGDEGSDGTSVKICGTTSPGTFVSSGQ